MSNIWTAAGEGDLQRVQELVESGKQRLSPSVADENSYTPIHAAASWGHLGILDYLVACGGDINVVDADGETPLFLVETAEMARAVVGLGGNPGWKNAEGISAAQSLHEDYPHISLYLCSLTGEPVPLASVPEGDADESMDDAPDASSSNPNLDAPTDELLLRVKEVMEASERGDLTSEETDTKLREIVESAVRGTVSEGRALGEMETEETGRVRGREEEGGEDANGDKSVDSGVVGKRRREEEPGR